MKAKTDSGSAAPDSVKPDYIENLFTLLKLVSAEDVHQKFNADFNACNIRYGDLKKQLAEDMVQFVKPIRERAADIQNDKALLTKIMHQGKEKARASAAATLTEVRNAIGMNY